MPVIVTGAATCRSLLFTIVNSPSDLSSESREILVLLAKSTLHSGCSAKVCEWSLAPLNPLASRGGDRRTTNHVGRARYGCVHEHVEHKARWQPNSTCVG